MKLPKSLTTVTPLSKALAMICFITLPIIVFFLGMEYQKITYEQINQQSSFFQKLFCKEWETICAPSSPHDLGGCAAFRVCTNPVPPYLNDSPQQSNDILNISPNPTLTESSFCGGLAGKSCPDGYTCQLNSKNPDASGTCIAETPITKPSCTPHVPIGGTGSIPSNDIYPTLPPGGSWCPSSQPTSGTKMCPMLAYKNPEGKTCNYTGPNCSIICK